MFRDTLYLLDISRLLLKLLNLSFSRNEHKHRNLKTMSNLATLLKDEVISNIRSQYGVVVKPADLTIEQVVDEVSELTQCIYDLYTNNTNGFRCRVFVTTGDATTLGDMEVDRYTPNNPIDGRTLIIARMKVSSSETVLSNDICPDASTFLLDAPTVTSDALVGDLTRLDGTAEEVSLVHVEWVDGTVSNPIVHNDEWTATSSTVQPTGPILVTGISDDGLNTKVLGYEYYARPVSPVVTGEVELPNDTTTISGTAPVGSVVTVSWITGTQTSIAADDGTWSLTSPGPQPTGLLVLVASHHGKVSLPTEYSYYTSPLAPIVVSDTVDVGGLVTLVVNSQPEATVEATWPDGSTTVGTADVNGVVTLVSPSVQVDGDISVVATAHGKDSDPTGYVFYDRPTLPVITSDTATPSSIATLVGTADTGSTVEVTWNDSTTGSVVADANGDWTVTSTTSQVSGDIEVTSSQYGKTSFTATYTYTAPPSAPVVVSTELGHTGLLHMEGTADTNSVIEVLLVDNSTITAVTDALGDWSIDTQTSIVSGDIEITSEQNGKVSPTTTYVYDATPEAPVVVSESETLMGMVVLVGTSKPNYLVNVKWISGEDDSTSADDNGDWTLTSPSVQDTGGIELHTLVNSIASTVLTYPYASIPDTPVVVSSSTSQSGYPVLTGTAVSNGTITATWSDSSVTDTVVTAGGAYTVIGSSILPAGDVEVTVFNGTKTSLVNTYSYTPTVEVPSSVENVVAVNGDIVMQGVSLPGTDITITWPDTTVITTAADADGNWVTPDLSTKPDGTVSINSVFQEVNGPELEFGFVIAPQAAPTVTSIVEAGGNITATGTSLDIDDYPGSVVTITWTDSTTSTTSPDGDGNWSIVHTGGMVDGDVSVIVTYLSRDSVATTATFTQPMPETPVVTSVSESGGDITLTGTSLDIDDHPGAVITVTWTDTTTTSTSPDGDGNWTSTHVGNTVDGNVTVSVNYYGKDSLSAVYNMVVPPVAAPTVTSIVEAGGDITATGTSVSIDDFAGTVITVTWTDGTTGTTSPDSNGDWSVVHTGGMPDGDVSTVANYLNRDSVITATAFVLPVPVSPVVTSATDLNGEYTLVGTSLDIDDFPGTVVTVTWTDATTTTATPDGNGDWTVSKTGPMVNGDVLVKVSYLGKDSADTTYVLNISVPAAPLVTSATDLNGEYTLVGTSLDIDDYPGAVVTVTWTDNSTSTATPDGNGDWTVSKTGPMANGNVLTKVTYLGRDSADSTYALNIPVPATPVITSALVDTGVITVLGTSLDIDDYPGAVVSLTWTDNSVVSATPDSDGNWTVSHTGSMPDGDLTAKVTYLGRDSLNATLEFTIPLPATPTITSVTESGGNITAVGTSLDIDDYPGSVITVAWADGSTGTTAPDGNGDWTVVHTGGMPDGNISVRVTYLDRISAAATAAFAQDTPVTPVITSVTESGGNITAVGTSLDIDDNPGAVVTVTWTDSTTGTVSPDGNGDWTVVHTGGMPDGNVTAKVTYLGKDSLDATSAFAQPTPVTPVITSVTESGGDIIAVGTSLDIDDFPGALVTVTWPDTTTGSVLTDTDGNWTVTHAGGIPDGDVVVKVSYLGVDSANAILSYIQGAPTTPIITSVTESGGNLIAVGTSLDIDDNPGAVVTVTWPDTTTTTATPDGDGDWTATFVGISADGNVLAKVTYLGVDSTDATLAFTAPTPATPVMTSADLVGSDVVAVGTSLDIDDYPGAVVTVTWTDATTTTATPDGNGDWTATHVGGITSGTITASVNYYGKDSADTTLAYTAPVPATPVITSATITGEDLVAVGTSLDIDDFPGAVVTVTWTDSTTTTTSPDTNGDWTATHVGGITSGNITASVTHFGVDSADATLAYTAPVPATPVITSADISGTDIVATGTSLDIDDFPGAVVTVTWTDSTTTTTSPDTNGDWTATHVGLLDDGNITASVNHFGVDSLDATLAFSIPVPATPVITSADLVGSDVVAVGTSLDIDNNPGAVVTVTWTDATTTTATPDSNGDWTATHVGSLADGNITASVNYQDRDSLDATFAYTSSVPDTPVITSINIPGEDITISGTSLDIDDFPGAVVTVTLTDATTTTATPDGNGDWAVVHSGVLADGNITAKVTYQGVDSLDATVAFVNVSLENIVQEVISYNDAPASYDDPVYTLSGTSAVGSVVTATWSNSATETATTDGNGDWSITGLDRTGHPGSTVSLASTIGVTTRTRGVTWDIVPPANHEDNHQVQSTIAGVVTISDTFGNVGIDEFIRATWADGTTTEEPIVAGAQWTVTSPAGKNQSGNIVTHHVDAVGNVTPVHDALYTGDYTATIANSSISDTDKGIVVVEPTPGSKNKVITVTWGDGTTDTGLTSGLINSEGIVISTTNQTVGSTVSVTIAGDNNFLSPVVTDTLKTPTALPTNVEQVRTGTGGPPHAPYNVYTLDGNAIPNSTVYIMDSSGELTSVTSDGNSDWSYAFTENNMPDGTANIISVDGSTLSSIEFNIDTIEPSGGTLTSILADTTTGVVTVTGTVSSVDDGDIIEVRWTDGLANTIPALLNWTIDSPPGKNVSGEMDVRHMDSVGGHIEYILDEGEIAYGLLPVVNSVGVNGAGVASIVIDATAPNLDVIVTWNDGSTTKVVSDANGEASFDSIVTHSVGDTIDWVVYNPEGFSDGTVNTETLALATTAPANVVQAVDGGTVSSPTYSLSGTADANAIITATYDDSTTETGTADGNGDWSITGITKAGHPDGNVSVVATVGGTPSTATVIPWDITPPTWSGLVDFAYVTGTGSVTMGNSNPSQLPGHTLEATWYDGTVTTVPDDGSDIASPPEKNHYGVITVNYVDVVGNKTQVYTQTHGGTNQLDIDTATVDVATGIATVTLTGLGGTDPFVTWADGSVDSGVFNNFNEVTIVSTSTANVVGDTITAQATAFSFISQGKTATLS